MVLQDITQAISDSMYRARATQLYCRITGALAEVTRCLLQITKAQYIHLLHITSLRKVETLLGGSARNAGTDETGSWSRISIILEVSV